MQTQQLSSNALNNLAALSIVLKLRQEGRISDSIIFGNVLKQSAELQLAEIKRKRFGVTDAGYLPIRSTARDLIVHCLGNYDPSQATAEDFGGEAPPSAEAAAGLQDMLSFSRIGLRPDHSAIAEARSEEQSSRSEQPQGTCGDHCGDNCNSETVTPKTVTPETGTSEARATSPFPFPPRFVISTFRGGPHSGTGPAQRPVRAAYGPDVPADLPLGLAALAQFASLFGPQA